MSGPTPAFVLRLRWIVWQQGKKGNWVPVLWPTAAFVRRLRWIVWQQGKTDNWVFVSGATSPFLWIIWKASVIQCQFTRMFFLFFFIFSVSLFRCYSSAPICHSFFVFSLLFPLLLRNSTFVLRPALLVCHKGSNRAKAARPSRQRPSIVSLP